MPRTASRLLGGRYRVEDLLGEGAMSTVSRGSDDLLQRTVAIKLLKPLYASDSEFVARFYNEACSAAKSVHPNVVCVYDVLTDGKAPHGWKSGGWRLAHPRAGRHSLPRTRPGLVSGLKSPGPTSDIV